MDHAKQTEFEKSASSESDFFVYFTVCGSFERFTQFYCNCSLKLGQAIQAIVYFEASRFQTQPFRQQFVDLRDLS